MTPKEKAIELVKLMYGNIFDGGEVVEAEDAWYRAKQCAIIVVDEIINTHPLKMVYWGELISDKPYWQEVKQEIENL